MRIVTVEWSGKDPLVVGKQSLMPGRNSMTLEAFHALGANPECCEHIGAGRLKAVCVQHRFPVEEPLAGSDVCLYCHVTRQQAVDARPTLKKPADKPA